jgi:predicted ATP-grasp superfamily ATP-dependent carboligase
MKLILTDLDARKAFDIFNLIKHYNYQISGYSSSNRVELKILELIYGQKIGILDKNNLSHSFRFAIDDIDTRYIYFPIEEDTTIKFYDLIQESKISNFYYKLPPKESFDCVRDKSKFSKYCSKNNLPIPLEFQYDYILQLGKLPCNLIIKPKFGSGSMGIKFIDTFDEFLSCRELDFEQYIIQERLDNSTDIEGAFFLFDDGKLISYYGHKRIRTYPQNGGVTVYSKCETNIELRELGSKLLKSLNWSGIAMVEFLLDTKSNTYKIIEVNPRAWGSIMLSEFSNANILKNYIQISLGNSPIESKIDKNRYIRWVFPWDVLSYIKNRGDIKDFWSFNRDNTCYINLSYSSYYRSTLFLIYNIFDYKKIKKLIKKVFK